MSSSYMQCHREAWERLAEMLFPYRAWGLHNPLMSQRLVFPLITARLGSWIEELMRSSDSGSAGERRVRCTLPQHLQLSEDVWLMLKATLALDPHIFSENYTKGAGMQFPIYYGQIMDSYKLSSANIILCQNSLMRVHDTIVKSADRLLQFQLKRHCICLRKE